MIFISAEAILDLSCSLFAQVSHPYNKAGKAKTLYIFSLVYKGAQLAPDVAVHFWSSRYVTQGHVSVELEPLINFSCKVTVSFRTHLQTYRMPRRSFRRCNLKKPTCIYINVVLLLTLSNFCLFLIFSPIHHISYLITVTFYSRTKYYCGPGSSVGIATELQAGRSEIESRWGRDFPPVQTGPGAHLASCKMGTGSFPGVKFGRGVLLITTPF